MTPLPERKKSTEEIAALRDQLAIPGAPPHPAAAPPPAAAEQPPAEAPAPPAPRPIAAPHSLRKSEQRPVAHAAPAPPPDSPLPARRHSDREIADLRRRSVMDTREHAAALPVRHAHPAQVIAGYVAVATAAPLIYFDLPLFLPTLLALAALAFGVFLFLMRPYSRHHGAFIGIAVLFVLTYGALHYFPQLRHAT